MLNAFRGRTGEATLLPVAGMRAAAAGSEPPVVGAEELTPRSTLRMAPSGRFEDKGDEQLWATAQWRLGRLLRLGTCAGLLGLTLAITLEYELAEYAAHELLLLVLFLARVLPLAALTALAATNLPAVVAWWDVLAASAVASFALSIDLVQLLAVVSGPTTNQDRLLHIAGTLPYLPAAFVVLAPIILASGLRVSALAAGVGSLVVYGLFIGLQLAHVQVSQAGAPAGFTTSQPTVATTVMLFLVSSGVAVAGAWRSDVQARHSWRRETAAKRKLASLAGLSLTRIVTTERSQRLVEALKRVSCTVLELTSDGVLLYVSPNVTQTLGSIVDVPEDLLGVDFMRTVQPEDAAPVLAVFKQLAAAGNREAMWPGPGSRATGAAGDDLMNVNDGLVSPSSAAGSQVVIVAPGRAAAGAAAGVGGGAPAALELPLDRQQLHARLVYRRRRGQDVMFVEADAYAIVRRATTVPGVSMPTAPGETTIMIVERDVTQDVRRAKLAQAALTFRAGLSPAPVSVEALQRDGTPVAVNIGGTAGATQVLAGGVAVTPSAAGAAGAVPLPATSATGLVGAGVSGDARSSKAGQAAAAFDPYHERAIYAIAAILSSQLATARAYHNTAHVALQALVQMLAAGSPSRTFAAAGGPSSSTGSMMRGSSDGTGSSRGPDGTSSGINPSGGSETVSSPGSGHRGAVFHRANALHDSGFASDSTPRPLAPRSPGLASDVAAGFAGAVGARSPQLAGFARPPGAVIVAATAPVSPGRPPLASSAPSASRPAFRFPAGVGDASTPASGTAMQPFALPAAAPAVGVHDPLPPSTVGGPSAAVALPPLRAPMAAVGGSGDWSALATPSSIHLGGAIAAGAAGESVSPAPYDTHHHRTTAQAAAYGAHAVPLRSPAAHAPHFYHHHGGHHHHQHHHHAHHHHHHHHEPGVSLPPDDTSVHTLPHSVVQRVASFLPLPWLDLLLDAYAACAAAISAAAAPAASARAASSAPHLHLRHVPAWAHGYQRLPPDSPLQVFLGVQALLARADAILVRGGCILHTLLRVSRFKSPHLPAVPRTGIDAHAVVLAAAEAGRHRLAQAGVLGTTLSVVLRSAVPPAVDIDSDRLRHVLDAAIGSAVDATSRGRPSDIAVALRCGSLAVPAVSSPVTGQVDGIMLRIEVAFDANAIGGAAAVARALVADPAVKLPVRCGRMPGVPDDGFEEDEDSDAAWATRLRSPVLYAGEPGSPMTSYLALLPAVQHAVLCMGGTVYVTSAEMATGTPRLFPVTRPALAGTSFDASAARRTPHLGWDAAAAGAAEATLPSCAVLVIDLPLSPPARRVVPGLTYVAEAQRATAAAEAPIDKLPPAGLLMPLPLPAVSAAGAPPAPTRLSPPGASAAIVAPAAAAAAPAPEATAVAVSLAPVVDTAHPLGNFTKHILFVDDEATNCKLGERMLARLGCTCTTLEDGSLVLPYLQANAGRLPDAICMDIFMSQSNGAVVCRELRQAGYTMPMVAMTGHAGAADVHRLLACGFDVVVHKPFNIKMMSKALEEAFAQHAPAAVAAAAPAATLPGT